MRSQALEELKTALDPYLFFWEEWSTLGVCVFEPREIEIINHHIKNNFQVTVNDLVGHIVNKEKRDEICLLIVKLKRSTDLFRDSVVVNFLSTLIVIARDYPEGYDRFLLTPVKDLKIPQDLVNGLMSFKVYSVHLLVILIRPDDFTKGWIFRCVSNFVLLNKKYNANINQKPIETMKNNSS
jgi:hypothetical protein